MYGQSVFSSLAFFFKSIFNPEMPALLRLASAVFFADFIVFAAGELSLKLHHPLLSAHALDISQATFGITMLVALTYMAIDFLRRDAAATDRGMLGYLLSIVAKTFLFLFLPCALVTAALVLWAVLTHQPAFR